MLLLSLQWVMSICVWDKEESMFIRRYLQYIAIGETIYIFLSIMRVTLCSETFDPIILLMIKQILVRLLDASLVGVMYSIAIVMIPIYSYIFIGIFY